MRTPLCPYCHEAFLPSRYRPDQVVCSAPECQRQRRAAYHRNKLKGDADYREQCRESQRQWREQHPNYMRSYRQAYHARSEQTKTHPVSDIDAMLDRVKNNLATDLTLWTGTVYVVNGSVKNILDRTDFLVITGLARR